MLAPQTKTPETLSYHDALRAAMWYLAGQRNSIFLGQGVADGGTSMASTFASVPLDRRLEMPVAEDMQMGMAIGMALAGFLPICVFPRWNFLICATNQIVNHLDRLPLYSDYRPKVIVRVAVPSKHPFNPGPQHDDDFTPAFRAMLRTVNLTVLRNAEDVMHGYRRAVESPKSTIMVEFTDCYRNERGRA